MDAEQGSRPDRPRAARHRAGRAPEAGAGGGLPRAVPAVAAALCVAILAGGFPPRAEAVAPRDILAVIVADRDVAVPAFAALPVLTLVAYPNPFVTGVCLTIEGPGDGAMSLRVYDVRGRFVRELVADEGVALPRSLVWDGSDHGGAAMASGTYYAVLAAGEEWRVQPLEMVK